MNILYNIENIINLLPAHTVILYKDLASIFHTTVQHIAQVVKHSPNYTKRKDKIISLQDSKNKKIWQPVSTNYYISLILIDKNYTEQLDDICDKIKLLHPNTIFKKPTHYHITLADMSWVSISENIIQKIFASTEWLEKLTIQWSFGKPFIDQKKSKVLFRVKVDHNPFLLTLYQCIKKIVPRKSDKQFIPHITIAKLLQTTEYNKKIEDISFDITSSNIQLVITANIDSYKDIILFSQDL